MNHAVKKLIEEDSSGSYDIQNVITDFTYFDVGKFTLQVIEPKKLPKKFKRIDEYDLCQFLSYLQTNTQVFSQNGVFNLIDSLFEPV